MNTKHTLIIGYMMTLFGCTCKEQVDLLVYDATIYTVNHDFALAQAFAVNEGRFVAVGTTNEIRAKYISDNEIDMRGAPVYPGFNDAHCHFVSLGKRFSIADLRGATSYAEVLERIAAHHEASPSEWIVGAGWDQNLWPDKSYPTNKELNKLYPNTPVVLNRVDGHATIANEEAIRRVGIKVGDSSILPGEALVQNGKFTGLFREFTADRLWYAVPDADVAEQINQILSAAAFCYELGLTSVSDAGLPLSAIELIDTLQQSGRLQMRVDAWISPTDENFERFKAPYRTYHLNVSCLKLYLDGALGSRGAWMLTPYQDEPSSKGIPVTTDQQFLTYCQKAFDAGLQVATHCIGDAANRRALELYATFLKEENDLRWRIEHAQIIAPEDFDLFKKYSIVPSVQPTHATSDMFWAVDRVGERIKGAYAFQQLKDQLGWIPFGTDFPVEEVNPIYTFFAAVFRKNLDFLPKDGFQMENAVTREDALRAMTIWAAKASFDETQKGSIE
ncbi:MAG: amidohydrolase, partial [Prevotellaceae bacterium]|nr:amidohydrolase [Prevotellaceae bacterium]